MDVRLRVCKLNLIVVQWWATIIIISLHVRITAQLCKWRMCCLQSNTDRLWLDRAEEDQSHKHKNAGKLKIWTRMCSKMNRVVAARTHSVTDLKKHRVGVREGEECQLLFLWSLLHVLPVWSTTAAAYLHQHSDRCEARLSVHMIQDGSATSVIKWELSIIGKFIPIDTDR